MRRILVIGSGGAGKSTLAVAVGAKLGLPVVHLDQLYWKPGWVPTPNEDWSRVVADLVTRDSWVLDGNYGGTLPSRIEACDTVIFLDVSRWRCLWRVMRRRLAFHKRSRPDVPEGCPERLTREFVRWIWTYPARRRGEILRRVTRLPPDKRGVVLRSARDIAAFLDHLAPGQRYRSTGNSST